MNFTNIEAMQCVGLIPDILDVFPEAQVVGSKVALMYLKGLTHRPFEQKPVKGGDKVELGAGHTLEFVMAPNLHWWVPTPHSIPNIWESTSYFFLLCMFDPSSAAASSASLTVKIGRQLASVAAGCDSQ